MRSGSTRILVAAVLVLVVCGCGADGQGVGPVLHSLPGVSYVRSDYSRGSVAPPDQYRYFIALSYGAADTISFACGDTVWTELFDASARDLQDLNDLMIAKGIFRPFWEIMIPPPIGGASRWLRVRAGWKTYEIPPYVRDVAATSPVYARIDTLVPAMIWDSLWARRGRYIRDQDLLNRHP